MWGWLAACSEPKQGEVETSGDDDAALHTGELRHSAVVEHTAVVVAGHSGDSTPTTFPPGPCDDVPPPIAPVQVMDLTRSASQFDFDDRGYVHYGDDFGTLRVADGVGYDLEGPSLGYYAPAFVVRAIGGDTVLTSGFYAGLTEVVYPFPFRNQDYLTNELTSASVTAADPRPNDDVVAILNEAGDLGLYHGSTGTVTVESPGIGSLQGALAWSASGDALWLLTTDGLERHDYDAAAETLVPNTLALPFASNLASSLAVDQCDNVYVLAAGGNLRRYNPRSGAVDDLGSFPTGFATQLRWGSGAGPFRRDRLYTVDFDSVLEVDVGFEGAPQPVDFP